MDAPTLNQTSPALTPAQCRSRFCEQQPPANLWAQGLKLTFVPPGSLNPSTIRYGVYPSDFGPLMLAYADTKLVAAEFVADAATAHQRLQQRWPHSRLVAEADADTDLAQRLLSPKPAPQTLCLTATPFQQQVWRVLSQVPFGQLVSYQQLAQWLGQPKASRAVGSAVAANPIAFLMPCHRVVRADGHSGQYRWGAGCKQALIRWESEQ